MLGKFRLGSFAGELFKGNSLQSAHKERGGGGGACPLTPVKRTVVKRRPRPFQNEELKYDAILAMNHGSVPLETRACHKRCSFFLNVTRKASWPTQEFTTFQRKVRAACTKTPRGCREWGTATHIQTYPKRSTKKVGKKSAKASQQHRCTIVETSEMIFFPLLSSHFL